ncbi:hypothetical protein WN943_011421 [Citrus x changshan-huyou]
MVGLPARCVLLLGSPSDQPAMSFYIFKVNKWDQATVQQWHGSKIKIYTWAELNRKSDSLSVPTALIWLYGWLHLDEFLLDGDEIGLLMVIEQNGSCKGTAFDLLNILQLTKSLVISQIGRKWNRCYAYGKHVENPGEKVARTGVIGISFESWKNLLLVKRWMHGKGRT